MNTLLASLLVLLPLHASAETALSQLGDAGQDIQERAGALSQQVAARSAADAKLDRVTAMPRAPEYTERKIEELKSKLRAEVDKTPPWRTRLLRSQIAELENKVEARFEDGGSCQKALDDAAADHRRIDPIVSRDMAAVHAAQLDAVDAVAAKLRADDGQGGSMLSALALDNKLILALAARFAGKPRGQGADAVEGLRYSLERQGLESLLQATANEVKEGSARVAAAAAASGLSPTDGGAALRWELHQGGEKPYLRACTAALRSSQELPPLPLALGSMAQDRKHYVQYRSCLDITLDDGQIARRGLREALGSDWATSDVVRLTEAAYANAAAGECLDLEAARRAYNELP